MSNSAVEERYLMCYWSWKAGLRSKGLVPLADARTAVLRMVWSGTDRWRYDVMGERRVVMRRHWHNSEERSCCAR